MSALSAAQVEHLLAPYLQRPLPPAAYDKVARYLAVFHVWSTRINLSTVREPVQVVRRHFGEGFVLAQALPEGGTLLDLGSGAGFPGFPIALARPAMKVTLAESQKKKASFLKEAAWMMGLPVKVWPERAEQLAPGTLFDVVTLRAVDNMSAALDVSRRFLAPSGILAFFVGEHEPMRLPEASWHSIHSIDIPDSPGHIVMAQLNP